MKRKEKLYVSLTTIDTMDWSTQKECRKAYTDYINNIINPELSVNPKIFWGFIKRKKCESVNVSPLKDSDIRTYSESEYMYNILNCQYSSFFTSNDDIMIIPDKGQSTHSRMENSHVA